MRITNTIEGLFQKRLNRFLCIVNIDGEPTECFLPNSGRLQELLVKGSLVQVLPKQGKFRRTSYDLFAIFYKKGWAVIDSRVPNILIYEALMECSLPEFLNYDEIQKEPTYGNSRLDFLLKNSNTNKKCLIEAKSCTLVKNGVALFPDAPTERGRRHLKELTEAHIQGFRSCIVFIIQRDGARIFSPNDKMDSKFGDALRSAKNMGVEVLAYSTTFKRNSIRFSKIVPISL
jgi:sugar fermentation stimulation protein A|tara:strand:- start:375 stop:1067 length:693 start_codon:yes stop_codon:yes gene_type:complete